MSKKYKFSKVLENMNNWEIGTRIKSNKGDIYELVEINGEEVKRTFSRREDTYNKFMTYSNIQNTFELIKDELENSVTKEEIEDLKKEYLKKMIEKQKRYDYDGEIRHIEEDNILCEILAKLGFKDIVEQYRKTSKWYA